MQKQPSAWVRSVAAIIAKDAVSEFRSRYAAGVLSMFALVTLASISMTVGGIGLSPTLLAALLWVIIFFSAMAGLCRVFVQEQEAGTLFTLRMFAKPQAVLFGKLIFNIILLTGLTLLIAPLFIIFFNVEAFSWQSLCGILLLGDIGIAAVATLTAAMVAHTEGKGSLFTVLSFPLLLPQFLTAIQTTEKVFSGALPVWNQLVFMAGYDATVIIAASILFDYLWND
ncbi:heme exporter protein CcmB [Sporolituus thermophilus]|uniref:Heme exporter protein B n=1 Tax=Sporolituus thermophilus DSM 23256 TaxID=1123285 RepID=A0A1G7LYA5_9FIRM|nr:heme exporter protein CcmB [Sporolituus thermophilus]SDF54548.1 heme exporter protein B [Sporolituus thermophilus DSM 23256]